MILQYNAVVRELGYFLALTEGTLKIMLRNFRGMETTICQKSCVLVERY